MQGMVLEIDFEKLVEIKIEFPLSILSQYRSISDLDETWDDEILPIINEVLANHNVHIKESSLVFTNRTKNYEKCLCYSMKLIVRPPLFSFDWIIDALKENQYEKGLCIEVRNDCGTLDVIYFDK